MHRSAYLFLLLTTLLWGGNSVAGKLAVDHVSPMTLVFLRWVLAVAILLPIGWRTLKETGRWCANTGSSWPRLGASGFTLFNTHLLHGAQLHDGDQCLDRTGGDADPDHRRQFHASSACA